MRVTRMHVVARSLYFPGAWDCYPILHGLSLLHVCADAATVSHKAIWLCSFVSCHAVDTLSNLNLTSVGVPQHTTNTCRTL